MEYNIWAYNVVCGMIRLGYVPSVLLVTSLETSTSLDWWLSSLQVTMINNLFPVSNNDNDLTPLFNISKKNQLYCVQKKRPYSLCSFHPKFCALKKAILFFHFAKTNPLYPSTKKEESFYQLSKKKPDLSCALKKNFWVV